MFCLAWKKDLNATVIIGFSWITTIWNQSPHRRMYLFIMAKSPTFEEELRGIWKDLTHWRGAGGVQAGGWSPFPFSDAGSRPYPQWKSRAAIAIQGLISSWRHRRVLNRTRPTPAFSSEELGIFHDSIGHSHTGSKHPDSPAICITPTPGWWAKSQLACEPWKTKE